MTRLLIGCNSECRYYLVEINYVWLKACIEYSFGAYFYIKNCDKAIN